MKITKYILSMAAALGMLAGCYKPEMVQIAAPEDVVAPVLDAVEGPIEITSANMANGVVTFSWTPADYGVLTQVNYSLEVATAAAPEAKVTITSGITDTTSVSTHIKSDVAYETLNAILYNDLKLADGIAEDVVFFVGAKVGEYSKIYSEGVTVSAKITAAEKEYPKMSVAGSYNGWVHNTQYLFDFAGDDKVYQAVIDFGEDHAANEFKITGGDWGKDEHSMDGAHDPESKTIKLVAGGGDNINVYQAKRYYHLAIDKTVPSLTANVSFDQIGVIGDFNSWGADVVMTFNASKQRFYADVEFPADGGFKFRLDGAWDVSYGSKTEGLLDSGDNIPVKAGNYRVYVNMNNFEEMTYSLDAKMFGKEEPVGGTTPPVEEPEPTPVVGWGLVGEYNGWGTNPDVMLVSDGTYLVAKGVELSGQVKFRKDGGWDVNFGAPGEVEPVEITPNVETELAAGGKNFTIAEGTYDVYLDETNAKAWFITDGSYPGGGEAPVAAEWGLIGSLAACNNWGVNVPLFIDGDYMVAKGVVFAEGDQFKFRKGETWGTEVVYEGTVMPDAEYACAAGGGNSTIGAAGTYDVYLAQSLDKFYVMTPGKTPADAGQAVVTYIDASAVLVGFSGKFAGVEKWGDPADGLKATFVKKTLTDEAKYAGTYEFKVEDLAIAENDEFKVRINGAWIGAGEGGAVVEGLTVSGTDNFIAGEAGTYDVTVTFAWDGLKHSDVKVIFSSSAVAADPWETAAKFVNGEDATDDALLKEIRAYADANNLYVRVTSIAALDGANYLDVDFCDGNGTDSVWWGWTTTGTNLCWNEHEGAVDAEGNLVSMLLDDKEITVKTEKTADGIMWYLTYPRDAVAKYVSSGKTYVSALLLKDWGSYWACPARGNAMLEVTL